MKGMMDFGMKPLSDRASAAEERAAKAEERAARLESRRSLDKVEDRFYKNNPALETHKADVESFLAEFPDNDKVDAKTFEKRLGLAADFVKGKVRNLRSETRRGEFSSRTTEEGETREELEEFSGRIDPRGLGGNRGAIALVENIAESFGQNTRFEDSVEKMKAWEEEEGRGVQIDSKEDIARARAMMSRGGNIGGSRGDK
jgi:hypothetical protein